MKETLPKSNPNEAKMISFIVPAMNEEKTVDTLVRGIQAEVEKITSRWEVLLIDDGSTDDTWNIMKQVRATLPDNVKAFKMRCNRGKADALALGYREANGDIIFTMDADLQDDPKEIPRFVKAIEEGANIVSGWKRKRYDPWHKVLPSRLFNAVISSLTGVHLHDHNCGFKAYCKDAAKSLPMYGDMHRMVPSLASFKGYKTKELEVEHHARQHGVSKYGWGRMLIGLMDTATVVFLQKFRNCPMHFMGNIALGFSLLAGICFAGAVVMAIFGASLAMPVSMFGVVFTAMAVMVGMQGLVLEHRVHETMKQKRDMSHMVANEDSSNVIQYDMTMNDSFTTATLPNQTLTHAS